MQWYICAVCFLANLGLPVKALPIASMPAGFGSPFGLSRGNYPAVLGGSLRAPRFPSSFPQAFNPMAGYPALGLNRGTYLGANLLPSGSQFNPYSNGVYSMVPNSLLPNLFGGGGTRGRQGAVSVSAGTQYRAAQGAMSPPAVESNNNAFSNSVAVIDPNILLPYSNPKPFGGGVNFAATSINPRGDGFTPFFSSSYTQQQQQPGSQPNQPGSDSFFPFRAADIPAPNPRSGDMAAREVAGRGIPSAAAIIEETGDDGK